MSDISKLEEQANLLFDNVAGWENSTLQRIGKRIGKYGKMSLAVADERLNYLGSPYYRLYGEKLVEEVK